MGCSYATKSAAPSAAPAAVQRSSRTPAPRTSAPRLAFASATAISRLETQPAPEKRSWTPAIRRFAIQYFGSTLTVSSSRDPAEQEASSVARKIVSMPGPSSSVTYINGSSGGLSREIARRDDPNASFGLPAALINRSGPLRAQFNIEHIQTAPPVGSQAPAPRSVSENINASMSAGA